MQQWREVASPQVVQSVQLVLASGVLETIGVCSARHGGIAERIIGILRYQIAVSIDQGNRASKSIFQRSIGPARIGTREDFVNPAADQVGSRRGARKLLRSIGSVKKKRGVLKVLRTPSKTIVLQAHAVQRCHLVPGIPGERI